jgi:hypothetical protein
MAVKGEWWMERLIVWIGAVAGALLACGLLVLVVVAFADAYDVCPADYRCSDALLRGFVALTALGFLLVLASVMKLRMGRWMLWILSAAGALWACGLFLLVVVAFSDAYEVCPEGNQCSDALSSGAYFLALAVVGLLVVIASARKLRSSTGGG